jgi:cytochrome c-type biogenesis protein CcmH/NrfF
LQLRFILTIAFCFFTSYLAAGGTNEDGKDPADFFSRIWSPYCPGLSLLECPSSQAEDLRREIRLRLKSGEGEEKIFSELNQKHRGSLRMEPAGEGRESLAYWIPWVAFALSILFVLGFWKLRKNRSRPKTATHKPTEEVNSKIIEDLKARL